MDYTQKSITLSDGRVISIETGRIARQADGAVILRCGDTMLLATVVARKEINLEFDFLPLSVDYLEKYSSAGRIPGGFFKREGKLSDNEVLISRLVDRALRPLFPEDYRGDTQVIIQLISSDREEQPDALACLAASTAIMISDLPFPEPVSEVRVGRMDGNFIINPTFTQMEACDLDLMVAGTDASIVMVEGEMLEVSEDVVVEALEVAHEAIRNLNKLQTEMMEAAGKPKREYEKLEFLEDLYNEMEAMTASTIEEISRNTSAKENRSAQLDELKKSTKEALTEKYAEEVEYLDTRISMYFKKIQKKVVRSIVLKDKLRLDGRKPEDIRPIWCEAGFQPRAHGSAIFTRGETQSLCTVTLGTKLDAQTVDTATLEGSKKFMLHYNFPPFSTGEVKFLRGPARREIGHGNLAERALKIMLPDDLVYTVRLESNILESNGSSSMASVCGGTLALMDAGIQIKRPVSGIAMGLITDENGNFAVLSDILGDEDFLGDMDFKVTGTERGLTACQMDIKIRGLSYEIIRKALHQSRQGRIHILLEMLKALPEPRQDLSPYAPRFHVMEIPMDSFGSVIGPGGKVVQEMQRTTNTTIVLEEIEGRGVVTIASADLAGIEKAVAQIKALTQMPEVGEVYMAKVKSIKDFGAFVEFLPGKEGLLHISEISYDRLPSMEGVLEIGQDIEIKIIGIDERSGKFRLSHKVLLPKPEGYVERERGGDRGGRGGDRRGGDRGGDRDRNRNNRR
jgi:polyribonucleotide nucleotidyltransferase